MRNNFVPYRKRIILIQDTQNYNNQEKQKDNDIIHASNTIQGDVKQEKQEDMVELKLICIKLETITTCNRQNGLQG